MYYRSYSKPWTDSPVFVGFLIVAIAAAICIPMYWFYTNHHCVSSHVELQCTGYSSKNTGFHSERCREVNVCDDWERN